MGGHLVEEDEGREPAHGPHQTGMGQDEADQQCLLLARGSGGGGHVLGAVPHDEIGGLRSDQGSARGTVAVPALHQSAAEAILRLQGRPDRDEVVEVALQPQRGPREGRSIVPRLGNQPIEALHGLAPGKRHGDPELGHFALHRIEPAAIVRPLVEQAVARPKGSLHRRDPGTVAGVNGKDQTVEKTAPVAGRSAEQAVEIRRQPDDAQKLREGDG